MEMMRNPFPIIRINPIEYIIRLDSPFIRYGVFENNYNEALKISADIANNRIYNSNENTKIFKTVSKSRKAQLQKVATFFNSRLNEVRKEIKNQKQRRIFRKDQYWKRDSSAETKDFIRRTVSAISRINYTISDSFDWNQIELFVYTLDHFFKSIVLSKAVFKPNDFYDLFNMVYVGKNDKYLTREKSINRYIKDAGMNKYKLNL